jgi:hypothetical protein
MSGSSVPELRFETACSRIGSSSATPTQSRRSVASQVVKKASLGCVTIIAVHSEPGINTRTTDVGTWPAGYFVSLLQMNATERTVSVRRYNASTASSRRRKSMYTCYSLSQLAVFQYIHCINCSSVRRHDAMYVTIVNCVPLRPKSIRNKTQGLSFVKAKSTVALSHSKPASARIFCDSCDPGTTIK